MERTTVNEITEKLKKIDGGLQFYISTRKEYSMLPK